VPVWSGDDASSVQRAAERLAAGERVAFPTETVYGLGARADDDAAVASVFAAKGRPADHPLIVHVTGADAAETFAAEVPAAAQRLVAAFWPGPLTLILPRRDGVAAAAAGGQSSVGLRCPAHPVAQALLAAAGRLGVPGVAAPSANRFGRLSPTRASHVVDEFGPSLVVLDGGACAVGIESSIVDLSRGRAVLLRPGGLGRDALEAVLGAALAAPDAEAPRASGTLASHYAPRARLRLFADGPALAAALQTLPAAARQGVAVYCRAPLAVTAAPGWTRPMPTDAAAAAHQLFDTLRALDAAGADEIWVQAPPADADWDGVRDRLQRAAA
jgi:L-threonylcarbamoyladenylate synthase